MTELKDSSELWSLKSVSGSLPDIKYGILQSRTDMWKISGWSSTGPKHHKCS